MADESNVEIQPEVSPSAKRRRRNQQYYEKNKDSLKANKESYTFKLEVPKADVRGIYPTYNTIEGGFLRELLRT